MKKILCVMLIALSADFCNAGPAWISLRVEQKSDESGKVIVRTLSNKEAGITITQTGKAAEIKIPTEKLESGEMVISEEQFIPLLPTTTIKYEKSSFSVECRDTDCTFSLPGGVSKEGKFVAIMQSADVPNCSFNVYECGDEYMCVTTGFTYVCKKRHIPPSLKGKHIPPSLKGKLYMVAGNTVYDFYGVSVTTAYEKIGWQSDLSYKLMPRTKVIAGG